MSLKSFVSIDRIDLFSPFRWIDVVEKIERTFFRWNITFNLSNKILIFVMSWIWLKVEYRKVNVVSEIDDSVMPLTGSWAILRLERAIVNIVYAIR